VSSLRQGIHRINEPSSFQKFTNVFIDYLKSALGDKFPPAAEDAFKKLMGAFNKKIGQHLK